MDESLSLDGTGVEDAATKELETSRLRAVPLTVLAVFVVVGTVAVLDTMAVVT